MSRGNATSFTSMSITRRNRSCLLIRGRLRFSSWPMFSFPGKKSNTAISPIVALPAARTTPSWCRAICRRITIGWSTGCAATSSRSCRFARNIARGRGLPWGGRMPASSPTTACGSRMPRRLSSTNCGVSARTKRSARSAGSAKGAMMRTSGRIVRGGVGPRNRRGGPWRPFVILGVVLVPVVLLGGCCLGSILLSTTRRAVQPGFNAQPGFNNQPVFGAGGGGKR